MKRILFFMLLISVFAGLPVAVSYAQALDPGCSPDMWGYLEDQANAVRSRDRAYEFDIINREQSALFLTCFDQAMVASARLGYIFSDNAPASPPPANTVVFTDTTTGVTPPAGTPAPAEPPGAAAGGATGTVAFPDWGATHALALDLDSVVSPELDNEMLNFLPPWVTPNALTTMATDLKPLIDQITTFQTGPDATGTAKADEEGYIKEVRDIDSFVTGLPQVDLPSLPDDLKEYQTDITDLTTIVDAISKDRTNVMTPLLDAIKGKIFSAQEDCLREDAMWTVLNGTTNGTYNLADAGVYYPPESTTYYPLTPYYTLQDFLNVPPVATAATATAAATVGASPDFVAELKDATDATVLAQALADLTGPLAQAGNSPIWPAPPVFNPTTTDANDVIKQM